MARAETGAVRAVAALAHPSWSDAVIGAAAAIAAEHAVSACARQFVAEVRLLPCTGHMCLPPFC